MTYVDFCRTAFSFRRAWLKQESTEGAKDLNGCDALLIALIVVATRVDRLLISNAPFGRLLRRAIDQSSLNGRLTVEDTFEATSGGLQLKRSADLLDGRPPEPGGCVVYGLAENLGPSQFCGMHLDTRLYPFAFASPALWSSRLAWCCLPADQTATRSTFDKVVDVISASWLDPLQLFEAVQSSRAQADGLEGRDHRDEDMVARVAQLEQEVRSLETSGLVRHEELIASAARRHRFEK